MFKKIIGFILAAALLSGCFVFSSFAADGDLSGTLKIVNYNVAGLSLPSFISPDQKDTKLATKKIGQYFKAYDYDVMCVQEDFNYHFTLSRELDADCKTYWDGGMGFGSGLNIFSRHKLYNVGRVPWEEAYGVFDAGSDELTPKGIVYATIELAPGAYVDIYNIHTDAYGDDGSIDAKFSQFRQLCNLIESRDNGHAVIVTGDFNTYFTLEGQDSSGSDKTRPGIGVYLRELFHNQGGFDETWIEACFDGDYDFTADDIYSRFLAQYPDHWGYYDSAEKLFYRGSDAVSFSTVSHEYRWISDESGTGLSDHVAELVALSYTVNAEACKAETLKANRFNPFEFIYHCFGNVFNTIRLLLRDLPALILGDKTIVT